MPRLLIQTDELDTYPFDLRSYFCCPHPPYDSPEIKSLTVGGYVNGNAEMIALLNVLASEDLYPVLTQIHHGPVPLRQFSFEERKETGPLNPGYAVLDLESVVFLFDLL